jgi:hypothetical protein
MPPMIFQRLVVVLVLSCFYLGSVPVHAQSLKEDAKIGQILKDTGFSYKAPKAGVWSIDFERETLGKFKVIISTGPGIVVTFAIVAEKANINMTLNFAETLLLANQQYDYVKVGLNKGGDLVVRIDNQIRTIDVPEMKDMINQVANASEQIFVKVSGSINR